MYKLSINPIIQSKTPSISHTLLHVTILIIITPIAYIWSKVYVTSAQNTPILHFNATTLAKWMIVVTYPFETSVDFQRTIQCCIPEDRTVLPGNLSKASDFKCVLFLGEDWNLKYKVTLLHWTLQFRYCFSWICNVEQIIMYVRYGCNHWSTLKQETKSNSIIRKEEIRSFQTYSVNFKKCKEMHDIWHLALSCPRCLLAICTTAFMTMMCSVYNGTQFCEH
jgi:hypothetical protein